LPEPVFSHGQLYVALSKSGKPANVTILVEDIHGVQEIVQGNGQISKYTKNVVYREDLTS